MVNELLSVFIGGNDERAIPKDGNPVNNGHTDTSIIRNQGLRIGDF